MTIHDWLGAGLAMTTIGGIGILGWVIWPERTGVSVSDEYSYQQALARVRSAEEGRFCHPSAAFRPEHMVVWEGQQRLAAGIWYWPTIIVCWVATIPVLLWCSVRASIQWGRSLRVRVR